MSALLIDHIASGDISPIWWDVIDLMAQRGVCFQYKSFKSKVLLTVSIQGAVDDAVTPDIITTYLMNMVSRWHGAVC